MRTPQRGWFRTLAKGDERTLHYFGLPGSISEQAVAIATEAGFRVVCRTSERFSDQISSQSLHASWIVSNSLEEAMRKGPQVGPFDVALSVSAPWIFDRSFIRLWNGRIFNVHFSQLPRFRGGGGLTWPILLGDREFGVTIHQLTEGIDDGPIVASLKLSVGFRRKNNNIVRKHELSALKLLRRILPKLLEGRYRVRKQREQISEYWPRINASTQGWVDWSWTAKEIVQFSEGFLSAGKHVTTECKGQTVNLMEVKFEGRRKFHPFSWGIVFRKSTETGSLKVAAKGGQLSMRVASPDGLKTDVRLGDRLFTPLERLEKAKSSRPRLSPSGQWS